MADVNAKLRAAQRWVEIMTPAAARGIGCPRCQAVPDVGCTWFVKEAPGVLEPALHPERYEHARAELQQIALTLFDLG